MELVQGMRYGRFIPRRRECLEDVWSSLKFTVLMSPIITKAHLLSEADDTHAEIWICSRVHRAHKSHLVFFSVRAVIVQVMKSEVFVQAV